MVMVVLLALTGCASFHSPACTGEEQAFIQDSLYFGTAKPVGIVTPGEWADFLNKVVSPRFPQGLTVWEAAGQWRGGDGAIVREASRVLNLLHPDDAASEKAVVEIVVEYKARFQQEAVLRVKAPACISF
ncbi:DUF3574 domain-containing protein [Ramlibacter sp. WS9]|nr:DUF3574 domain-containing protein [Ramlibacter sp. WS9]